MPFGYTGGGLSYVEIQAEKPSPVVSPVDFAALGCGVAAKRSSLFTGIYESLLKRDFVWEVV